MRFHLTARKKRWWGKPREQKSDEGDFYFYRGTVYWDKSDFDNAISGLQKGEGIQNLDSSADCRYEEHFGVQLPEDIKAILTQPANSPD